MNEEESFIGKIIGSGQVTIPEQIRDAMKLKLGDAVRITVRKVKP